MAMKHGRTFGGYGVQLDGRWDEPGSRADQGRIKGREVRAVGGERVQRVSDGIGDVRFHRARCQIPEQLDRIHLFAMCARRQ